MKINFDKVDGTISVADIPFETTKMDLEVNEFSKQGQPDENGKWTASIGIELQATLQAVKVESGTTDVPLLDADGKQVEVGGVLQTVPKTETVETVLETKVVDLKVL